MSMELDIINKNGDKTGSIAIEDSKVELVKGEQAVHDAVVAFLASQHRPTASTKTRSNITGGGCKPFKQKGMGRARAGTIRSPLWRHGAVTFGPLPERNYKKCMNKKVMKLALKRAFSERLQEKSVIVCEKLEIESGKTKDAADFLKKVGAGQSVLIISAKMSEKTALSLRNFNEVTVHTPSSVSTYDILLRKKILFDKESAQAFISRI